MKKILLCLLSCLLLPAFLWAQSTISLGGVNYTIDTLETFQCGPGSQYIAIQMRRVSDRGGRLDAFLMKVDANNPYISFEEVMGGDKLVGTEAVSKMGERKNQESDTRVFFGGTNGDFFVTKGDVGLPVGFAIINNEFARIPDNRGDRRLGAINEQMRGAIGSVGAFSGKVIFGADTMSLRRINYTRGEDQLVLFNRHHGPSTNTNEFGTELLLSLVEGDAWHTNCTVHAVVQAKEQNKGNMTIPKGQTVLSGHGTMAEHLNAVNVGDTLTIKLTFKIDGVKQNISQCIAGDNYALIVDNGKVVESNFWNEMHPRTAFGHSQNGDTVIFCVVDGRALSVGCNTQVLGTIMHHHGAYKAVNWDGGGSSHLWINNVGLMNAGCETAERSVANGMFAVANLPEADNHISQLQAYSPTLRLPQYGVHTPKVLGYNRFGVLLDPNVQGVTLSCDPSVGYIDDNGAFVCLGNGELRMQKGDAMGTVQIQIVNNSDIRMRLDTAVIYDQSDYPIEVITTVGKNDILIHPSVITWAVADPTIATVSEDGILNGLKDGITEIYGSLNGHIDTLVARVAIPATKPLLFDDFLDGFEDRWTVSANAKWNTSVVADESGKAAIRLNFTGGRNLGLMLTSAQPLFSAPNELKLYITPPDNLIEKLVISLYANGREYPASVDITSFTPNQPMCITVPLDSLFGVHNDLSIYPVRMDYIKFFLNSKAERDKDYSIAIPGIFLTYNGTTSTDFEAISSQDNRMRKNQTTKFIQDGQLYVIRNGQIYNILGTKVN